MLNERGDFTVAATDVEHTRSLGNDVGKVLAEHLRSAIGNFPIVDRFDPSHLRAIRRILMKKLLKIVWQPRAARVTPGMTSRMVVA